MPFRPQSTVAGWRTRTPAGFLFAAKFPKIITHDKGLVDCAEETTVFLERMTELDLKLGPLLLQMPPSFAATQLEALTAYLQALPTGFRYALEVRHRSWLAEPFTSRCWSSCRDREWRCAWCSTPGCPALTN